jgi:hypothetical protein
LDRWWCWTGGGVGQVVVLDRWWCWTGGGVRRVVRGQWVGGGARGGWAGSFDDDEKKPVNDCGRRMGDRRFHWTRCGCDNVSAPVASRVVYTHAKPLPAWALDGFGHVG